jgi:para-nitrobenzyl esterase
VEFDTTMHLKRSVIASLVLTGVMLGIVALVLSVRSHQSALAQPVRVENGLVQGTLENGLTVYRGIPFAAPPVGELRWRAPRPVPRWNGILNATEFKPACMQGELKIPGLAVDTMSEDCLYLNIWTPARSSTEKLAVMVWIYGGGNSHGSGSERLYWGDQLARKDVVVVTFNYRVLALGLLALPELTREANYHASGNYLLLDDIAALQWVQRNIAAFGGDPDNVTLFGHSAGAYHASVLMVSPLARGLFRRVIGQSGGDFSPGTQGGFPRLTEAEQTGIAYTKQFGVHSIAEMRRIPADRIVAVDAATSTPGGVSGMNTRNMDGYVIPSDVYQLYAEGKQTDVDLMVGYTADEGANMLDTSKTAQQYVADLRERFGNLANKFLTLFPASSEQEAARSQVHLQTEDVAWRIATWARQHARTRTNRVFVYYFSHVPPFPPFNDLSAAGHGAELPYVFGFPPAAAFYRMESPEKARADTRLADEMQTYWTNFAKTGDPNGYGLPHWVQFATDREQVLEFGDVVEMRSLPNKAEHELMNAYYLAAY